MSAVLLNDAPFAVPAVRDLVSGLIAEYAQSRERIERLHGVMRTELSHALKYFLEGNKDDYCRFSSDAVDHLFCLDAAVAALNAEYWSRAMHMTDVYNCMPQKRRDEWDTSIRERKTPEFTEENVRATLEKLLLSRSEFFAERVDGIFRGLSGEHVTNSPAGFTKRMIIAHALNQWYTASSKCGLINDLRCVIARFMGRDEPRWNVTDNDLRKCRQNWGKWHTFDGGALRIRVYKVGTAHLEIHPDMAWRLNAVLHTMYPNAIPAALRSKPPKPTKKHPVILRPLPFAVLEQIRDASVSGKQLTFRYDADKRVLPEAILALECLGGVRMDGDTIKFDYDPKEVIAELLIYGCIPDQKTHQFYPTPDVVAEAAMEMAEDRGGLWLEPSAGTGALADRMPRKRTHCVEVSALHCRVLKAKGHQVRRADFLEYAKTAGQYSNILMNPPFSQGRWKAHVEAAARLLNASGVMVAILPASARGTEILPGFKHEWSGVFSNEFQGTGVSVAIARMERAA